MNCIYIESHCRIFGHYFLITILNSGYIEFVNIFNSITIQIITHQDAQSHIQHSNAFFQVQCILQDVGSHIATPRGIATEAKLGLNQLSETN